MRYTVMVWGVVLFTLVIAAAAVIAKDIPEPGTDLDTEELSTSNKDTLVIAAAAVIAKDMPEPGTDLDTEELSTNNKDTLTMSEEEIVSDYMNLTARQARVNYCEKDGGKCMTRRTARKQCKGKIDKKSRCDTRKYVCCKSDGDCPNEFVKIAGTCYYFSIDQGDSPRPWNQAQDRCQDIGKTIDKRVFLAEYGDQVSCLSFNSMLQWITRTEFTHIWVGASYDERKGQWIWAHSGLILQIENSYWAPDEPNKSGSTFEDCVELMATGKYSRAYLNDVHCDVDRPFVCQIF